MKFSAWDFFSILGLIALLIIGVVFVQIYVDPYTVLNPFPPPTMPAGIVLPSATATLRQLPPTWTATPFGGVGGVVIQPSSTFAPTSTGFVIASFTPTPTSTPTPTNTPTPTRTRTPTLTFIPTSTPNYTATALSQYATDIAATSAAQTAIALQLTNDCAATQAAGGTCP